jgi:hypothetical protein
MDNSDKRWTFVSLLAMVVIPVAYAAIEFHWGQELIKHDLIAIAGVSGILMLFASVALIGALEHKDGRRRIIGVIFMAVSVVIHFWVEGGFFSFRYDYTPIEKAVKSAALLWAVAGFILIVWNLNRLGSKK